MLEGALLISFIICFFIPIGGFILIRKYNKKARWSFVVGILAFTVSQVCIRIPIITMVLPNFMWYQVMSINPYASGIFLGVTAGLFEEGARYIAFRWLLKKNRSFTDGLAFGLGHGGIEAVLFVGVNALVLLVMTFTGNGILGQSDAGNVLLGGIERLSAMAFHVGASLLVLYGFRIGKSLWYLGIAILLHTLLDAAIVILPAIFGAGILAIELYCGIFGGVTLAVSILLFYYKSKKEEEKIL